MSNKVKEFHLTLVRHGQTVANVSKRIQGHSDTPLTQLGVQQAKALGRFFRRDQNYNFDRIYASDLGRAYETSKIIASTCCDSNIGSIIVDSRLRERKYGHLFEGKPIEQLQNEAYSFGFDKSNFTQYTTEGGESMEDVKRRVDEFCNDILWRDCQTGEEVLVVSHWATIKEFLKLFQPNSGDSIRREHLLETPNAAFSRFRVRCKQVNETLRTNGNEAAVSPTVSLEVQVVCLHQTPNLSEEQISVNIRQQLE